MTLRSPTSTTVPLTYALPDYVAIHQCGFGFQHAEMSCQGIQWTRSPVTYLEVKANRESDKEEKEVVPLWDHKKLGQERYVPTESSFFCCCLQNYQGKFIVSEV